MLCMVLRANSDLLEILVCPNPVSTNQNPTVNLFSCNLLFNFLWTEIYSNALKVIWQRTLILNLNSMTVLLITALGCFIILFHHIPIHYVCVFMYIYLSIFIHTCIRTHRYIYRIYFSTEKLLRFRTSSWTLTVKKRKILTKCRFEVNKTLRIASNLIYFR